MSSYRNRRIRAQKKRHAQTVARLKDQIRSFAERGCIAKEWAAQTRLNGLLSAERLAKAFTVRAHTRVTLKDGTVKEVKIDSFTVGRESRKLKLQSWVEPKIGAPLGLAPTSLVLEKEPPKVHGVNAQRETRSRPKVGGAGGKKT